MSHARPFSVVRELSDGTVWQLRGSSSGSGFANDRVPYRCGSKLFSVTIDTGFPVMPTHASPLRANCLPATAQPHLRANQFGGLSISTTTLPLNVDAFAGRRTRIRVVYGASGVRTTAGPGAGQS